MELVTEKVEKQSPAQRNSMEGFAQTGFEITAIRHNLNGPTNKYALPMNTSHDIGWLMDKPLHAKMLRATDARNTTAPMLERGEWAPLTRTQSDPTVMNPMLRALNTKRWHCHGNQKSDVHDYAENYYECMHANPFQKTQPLARGG
jgi:hypothetical protein